MNARWVAIVVVGTYGCVFGVWAPCASKGLRRVRVFILGGCPHGTHFHEGHLSSLYKYDFQNVPEHVHHVLSCQIERRPWRRPWEPHHRFINVAAKG